jgi:hypothetical protein
MSAIVIIRPLLCFIAGLLLLFTTIPQQIQAQELSEGFEFEWHVTPESMKKDFGPIVMQQKLSDGGYRGVSASVSCSECEEYGVDIQLIQPEETRWVLAMSVVDADKFQRIAESKRFEITIDIKGRGGAIGKGIVVVNVYTASGSLFGLPLESEEEYLPEKWIGAAIQRLPEFTEHAISVYVLEDRWSILIKRNIEMNDVDALNDSKIVDSLCGVYFKGSDEDCYEKVLEVMTRSHDRESRNPWTKPQVEKVVPTAREIEGAEKIFKRITMSLSRRGSRPRYFYLVATKGLHPQLLGMVWATPPETETSADNGVHSIFVGESLRNTLDSLAPGLYPQLPAMLAEAAAVYTNGAGEREHDFRLIWPVKEP